ncbi:hypothetical protein DAPPUDRAFT_278240 [Daphnia pulex]|uniref:Uncharacterized protein n=1 Tax=Daphnia pulex TaxID=6669 RepID=E9I6U5_DAPPU|nr:hypothetical protein DAPPUDRAFT_278240 [Daphnia pulex]|eukprot:EFX60285.1 hypothetical protein DAPPUDRAFT_278240 [Daphnia pulex]
MAYGDDELPPDKDGGVAILDFLTLQMRSARNQKQMVAIGLHLGQMARVQRIFDRQGMQPEMLLDTFQRAVVRFVQPNPDKIARPFDMGDRLGEVDIRNDLPIAVQARCNHAQDERS